MPKNTPMGLIVAGFSFLFGFGLIWHIWWLAAFGAAAIVVALIVRSFEHEVEYTLKI